MTVFNLNLFLYFVLPTHIRTYITLFLYLYSTGNDIDETKVIAPLCIANDQITLYFGSKDRYFYSINSMTGKQNWNFSTSSELVMGCAVTGDNAIIFGNLNGDIFALNSTGNLLWKYITGTRVNSPAIGKTIYDSNYVVLCMLYHVMLYCIMFYCDMLYCAMF